MFSFGARREKPVLIADIESGSVGVAIAILKKGAPVKILVCKRAHLPLIERDEAHVTSSIITLFSETVPVVLKEYTESEHAARYGAAQSLTVVVGSPWVRSRSAGAEDLFTEEKTITDAMIKELAKRALSEPSTLDSSRVFESSVIRVQLNGYPTGSPVGKKAHHLQVTAFQSDIDQKLRTGVESVLGASFPGRPVALRSSIRALLAVLHERIHGNHYMILSMGTEGTDCISVHKEDLNEHSSLPIGVRSIAQRLSGEQGLPEEIFSQLRMLIADTCSTPSCEAIKTNLAKLEPELVRSFAELFSQISSRRKIPNTCLLVTHADLAPWLEVFLTRIDFAQFSVTAQPLAVTSLSPAHLATQVQWDSSQHEDTGISLASAFVNTA